MQFPAGSKSAWAGNHNPGGPPLTPRTFTFAGLPLDGAELAVLHLPGGGSGGQYLAGCTVSAQAPGGQPALPWEILLLTADNFAVPGGRLVPGTLAQPVALRLPTPLPLPPGSAWKLLARTPPNLTRSQLALLPETLTLTFWLQDAPGLSALPPGTSAYVPRGVGHDRVDLTNRIA